MAEYIERNKAVDAIADLMATGFVEDRFITPDELQSLQDELETLPAADVAPVVHGQWIKGVPFGFSGKPNGYRSVVPEQVMCVFTKTDIEFCVKNAVPVVQFAIFSHGMTINLSLNVRRRKRRKHGPEGLK